MITNINKIFAACFLCCNMAVVLTSCNDMLDTVPQGSFTMDQLNEAGDGELDADGLVASAYAGLGAHYFGNNEAFAGPSTNWIFDVRSDDAYKGGGGTGMEQNIHLLEVSELNSDNVSCLNKWQNNYYAVTRCNNAIKLLKGNTSLSDGKSLVGELKTLRAWYYFDLIRIFKYIPYFTEEDDASKKSNMEFSRDEIFEKIKTDLKEAIEVLPEQKSDKGRVTRTTALSILAKVCAHTGNWADVETYTSAVIDSKQYALFANFGDMSKVANNNGSESIFALQCSTDNDNAYINWSNLLNCTYSDGNLYGTGDDFFYGSQNLVNAFRTDSKGLPFLDGTFNDVNVDDSYTGYVDPRLDYTVGRVGYFWRGHVYTDGWCRAKETYGEFSNKKGWPAPGEAAATWPWGCSSLNFIFIRYADILLLKAEALIEQSPAGANAATEKRLADARALINEVRTRAYNTGQDVAYVPVDLTPAKAKYRVRPYADDNDGNLFWTTDQARRAVRMERRLELALEGHRWFDLQRWGDSYLLETMNNYMTKEAERRSYYKKRSVSADEIFLPLPKDEVDNSNGLYKQY